MAEASLDAVLRAGRAVLDAYERGVLPVDARYLADTLRMVLDTVDKRPADDAAPSDEDRIRDAMAEAQAHPGRTITR
jgi:hypothetical protein